MDHEINNSLKPVFDQICFLGRKYEISTVFDDFLTAALNFFTVPGAEPHNIRTFDKYDKEERLTIGALIPELVQIYNKHIPDDDSWCDPLGNLYEDINSKYKAKGLGQFFTPEHICDLMTQLTMDKEIKGQRVSDPTCGSGRTLLSFHIFNPGNYVFGQDLDLMCCKMACINLMVHGCQGEVIHCNSLKFDDFIHGWAINETLSTIRLPSIRPITREESTVVAEKRPEIPKDEVQLPSETGNSNPMGSQLTIF